MPILQGPLRGLRWIAGAGNHGCWLGSYEYDKQNAFWDAIQDGDVVYDLGANAGFYTLLGSRKAGVRGRVYSFEPLPLNLEYLRAHLAINQITNCQILDVAVSHEAGLSKFDKSENASMGHLSRGSGEAYLLVKTVTLDQLVGNGEIPPPSIIKCDVEGAEYDVLIGSQVTVRTHMPKMFLATHNPDVHARCCQFLLNLGYQLKPLDGLPLEQSSELYAEKSKD